MVEDLTLAMTDGVKIIVPNDLNVLTSYILLEQQDWFEAEIRFVRALARPGMRAVDVGANFGVYALALARGVGATGRIWAIEPGEEAADYLARSIVANDFTNVELIRCALSRIGGPGFLDTTVNPELRRLVSSASSATVEVNTLDRLALERGIEHVDIVKIDVEGEEANVLEGGAEFLDKESPLLMLEFKRDKHVNPDVFEPLGRHGYDCFRLVPGIHVLVPFYESEEADPYQINLFACRPSRARAIEEMGYLTSRLPEDEPPFACKPALDLLFERPYARSHARRWRDWAGTAGRTDTGQEYFEALRWFLAAHERGNSPLARYWAIEQAYLRLHSLLRAGFMPGRAASFVRVAAEYGRRAEAVAVSRRLVQSISQNDDDVFAEPLLAPWSYQENIAPDSEPRQWLLASAIESCEHLYHFSSYYKPSLAQEDLGARVAPRFLSPAYIRRESLFNRRAEAAGSRTAEQPR
jgi:FkbM family methyltransferase